MKAIAKRPVRQRRRPHQRRSERRIRGILDVTARLLERIGPDKLTTNHIAARKSPAAMNVTLRSADAGLERSSTFIMPMPTSEATSPIITVSSGSATAAAAFAIMVAEVAPIAMVATTAPT